MNMRTPVLCALLASALTSAASAQGQVVFEQLPNHFNFTYSDADCDVCGGPPLGTGQQTIAEDFVITAATTFQLNEITVWGVNDNGSPNDQSFFTVYIYSTLSGLPGQILYSEVNVPTVAVPTGVTLFGESEVEYTLSPTLPPQLPSGSYWIEIYNDTAVNPATWGWISAAPDPFNGFDGFTFSDTTPGSQWYTDSYLPGSPSRNMALRLRGDGASPGGPVQPLCFGAGCPCGNDSATAGCTNSTGGGALLGFSGGTSLAADDLQLSGAGLAPGQPALLIAGLNAVNGGAGNPFGDGLRCVGGSVKRLGLALPDANGDASWGPGLAAGQGWLPGDVRYFQLWYRDPIGSACGGGFNLSNGLEVIWQ
jgi:hypothetical protein